MAFSQSIANAMGSPFQPSYEHEVHFGEYSRQVITRAGTPSVSYNTSRDGRPGLPSETPFPTLSLICTPPCVVYSCLPRLIAVHPKTVYQYDVAALGAYLIELWEWGPNSTTALFARRPATLSAPDAALFHHLAPQGTPLHSHDINLFSFEANSYEEAKQSGSVEPGPHSERPRIHKIALPPTPPLSGAIDEAMCKVQKPPQKAKTAVTDWSASVAPGGEVAWSSPSVWSTGEEKCTSVGKSANDALFMAGCLDARTLLRIQMKSSSNDA